MQGLSGKPAFKFVPPGNGAADGPAVAASYNQASEPSDPWAKTKPVSIMASAHGVPVPLQVVGSCILDNATRYQHCEAAMQAGFPILTGPGNRTFDAPCILVGTGPSALALLPEIKERFARGEEIIAIKGAHDWLLDNGITPRAAIAMDPQQSRAKCFGKPKRGILYICASQMHPDAWEHLASFNVLVWNAMIDREQLSHPQWSQRYVIPVASTTGNSAIILLHTLGRRNFVLYGFDSSIPPATGWLARLRSRLSGRLLKLDGSRTERNKRVFDVTVAGRTYQTTAELAHQASELYPMLHALRDLSITAHGDGYYQALLAQGKASGWPV